MPSGPHSHDPATSRATGSGIRSGGQRSRRPGLRRYARTTYGMSMPRGFSRAAPICRPSGSVLATPRLPRRRSTCTRCRMRAIPRWMHSPGSARRPSVRRAARARVDKLLTQLGIDRYRDTYPGGLSGGERQRVAIARVLVTDIQSSQGASDPGPGSAAGRAVDGLAEQVGVPVVARVLLHEVLPHPPHRGGLLPRT